MSDNFDQGGQAGAAASAFDLSATSSGSGSGNGNHLATAPVAPSPERFVFSGRGSEYFRIWIVNLLLSVVTVGIYSAWAKVRRLRYFYDNTTVAGTSFEYHGNAFAILKGRAIAFALIVLFKLVFNLNPLIHLNPVVNVVLLAAVVVVLPWLIWKSLQFKLYNSSYRGIRFGFRGSPRQAYASYLMWPVLSAFTLALLMPFAHQRIKRFQHSESRFGATHFSFHAGVRQFYAAYLLGIGAWLGGVAAILLTLGGSFIAIAVHGSGVGISSAAVFSFMSMMLALYVWSFLALPLFFTLVQNLIWNNTRLGEHRFSSDMRWPRMIFIMLTNVIGIACTLGLFTPFAQIRLMRYRIESMRLHPASQLDEFIASTEAAGSAAGEGVADLLDLDISL